MLTTITVDVTIVAKDPKAAYARLASLLDRPDFEYETHVYVTEHDPEPRSTTELFPTQF